MTLIQCTSCVVSRRFLYECAPLESTRFHFDVYNRQTDQTGRPTRPPSRCHNGAASARRVWRMISEPIRCVIQLSEIPNILKPIRIRKWLEHIPRPSNLAMAASNPRPTPPSPWGFRTPSNICSLGFRKFQPQRELRFVRPDRLKGRVTGRYATLRDHRSQ